MTKETNLHLDKAAGNNPSSSGAVCLVSGGMDSLVSAAMASQSHAPLYFLHLNYGQRTEQKELECFHKIADFYQVPLAHRKTIDMSFLAQIGGSSLTDSSISVKRYTGKTEGIPDSYVPFRNTILLSLSVSWAEVVGAKRIYIGAVYEDSSGYPDCRPQYYRSMNQVIRDGTKAGDIEIVTPIIHLSKEQIVKKALELQAPLEFTWSCYDRQDLACGVCDSCALRLRGFQRAGVQDPIPYAAHPDVPLD